MLNAIRVLAKDEDEESINLKNLPNQTPTSISTPTKSKNYSETNFTPEISQKPATDNYGHTPTTMDTIYCRNIPGHFSELRFRGFMKECGEVTFMDFPLKSDGTPVGYAYVRFGGQECNSSAKAAISRFDKMVIDGFGLEVGMY